MKKEVMKKVFKYRLSMGVATLELPAGAVPLHVAAQGDHHGYLWALVDPAQPMERRQFLTVGTGAWLPEMDAIYIGTFMMHNSALVFHVFELPYTVVDDAP